MAGARLLFARRDHPDVVGEASGDPLELKAWDEMQPAPVSRGASYVAMDGHSGLWSTISAYEAVGYVCEQKR